MSQLDGMEQAAVAKQMKKMKKCKKMNSFVFK